MTSPTKRKFRVSIQIVEDYSAIVEAEDFDGAHDAADELFSACNVDAFDLKRHTFEVVDVKELAAGDPRPAVNLEVLP